MEVVRGVAASEPEVDGPAPCEKNAGDGLDQPLPITIPLSRSFRAPWTLRNTDWHVTEQIANLDACAMVSIA